ncbi:MAG: outer membrane beta-barrel protein [Verrucomicrobiota bacterium]
MKSKQKYPKPRRQAALRACLSGTIAVASTSILTMPIHAQDAARVDKVERENQELKQRLDALEAMAKKEGIVPSGQAPKMVSALSDISLSGFVQASYFYNTKEPADQKSDGYLWNTTHNSFSINKVKVTLASKPVERSGEKFDAGFRTSLIWGEDAPVLNTGNPIGGLEELREAYVEMNVPLGEGLNVKAGQLISLLNWESGDGGAVNPNFSQGYQWFYTGNGPSAGVQLGYTFTEWLDVKVRVQNGLYAGPIDGNHGKTVVGSIGIKPNSKTWFNLLGWGGDESSTLSVKGGSLLAGHDFTDQFHTGLEFDYFNFDPDGAPSGDLWSIGAWIWYDFTPKVSLALRGEYLDDEKGLGIKGIGLPGSSRSNPSGNVNSAIGLGSPDPDGDLSSITLTLTLKPLPNIRIQPEIRYDHTSYAGGLDGKKDRFLIGAGVSYLF